MKNKKIKIVIASGKGGVGKSMLTSVLVTLFYQNNKKIVAVDADVDAPNLKIWLGITHKPQKNYQISTLINNK